MISRLFGRVSKGNLKKFTRNASILFVNRDKAMENCVVLTPRVDFNMNSETLRSINARKLGNNYDLESLNVLWRLYNDLKTDRAILERQITELVYQVKVLVQDPKIVESKIANVKTQIELLRSDLRLLRGNLNEVETSVMTKLLKLPNLLHERTPETHTIVYEHSEKPSNNFDHITVAKNFDLVDIRSPRVFYLKKINQQNVFDRIMEKFHDYESIANSDFVRSVIVEGCGKNHEDASTFIVKDGLSDLSGNRLHLTGSASIESFMAFFAKTSVYQSILPLRFCTIGTKYTPNNDVNVSDNSSNLSLFDCEQTTLFRTFSVVNSSDSETEEIDKLLEIIKEIYKSFNVHFRVTLLSAESLNVNEQIRYDVEMFSGRLQRYVTVASIVGYGDYFSKRLVFHYLKGKEKLFPYVVSATVFDLVKFLACSLEQRQFRDVDEFVDAFF